MKGGRGRFPKGRYEGDRHQGTDFHCKTEGSGPFEDGTPRASRLFFSQTACQGPGSRPEISNVGNKYKIRLDLPVRGAF